MRSSKSDVQSIWERRTFSSVRNDLSILSLLQLYEKFISTFELKLNQLQLVLIATQIAGQFTPTRPFVPDGA